MKYFSAFAGVGGFDEGIKKACPDAKCIGYSEIDKFAVKIYEKHYPDRINYGDIKEINEKELPDFDMLCGGSPCQDFSIAGKRAGICGARSGLIYEVFRIVREKQPRIVFLENVPGVLSSNQGWDFAEIISELDGAGYDCEWELINTKRYLPQNRLRLFLIGHLRRFSWKPVFPLGESTGNTDEGREQPECWIFSNAIDSSYYKGADGKRQMIQVAGKSQSNRVYATEGIASTLRGVGGGQGAKAGLYIISDSGQGRKSQIRTEAITPLRANSGAGHNNKILLSHNSSIRRLTPMECERLQGFSDSWTAIGSDGKAISDSQRYKCLGNAVSVPVIKAIVQKMIEVNNFGDD